MATPTSQGIAAQQRLTEFTLFPKLPIELRLKIFKHALPTGPNGFRMLKVVGEIMNNPEVEEEMIRFMNSNRRKNQFAKKPPKPQPRPLPQPYIQFVLEQNTHSADIKDIGMSRACSESREVFLNHFTQSVRAKGESLIRFAEDILFIEHPGRFIWSFTASFGKFQKVTAKNVALPIFWCFNQSFVDGRRPQSSPVDTWTLRKTFTFLSIFQDLSVMGMAWDVVGKERYEELLSRALGSMDQILKLWKNEINLKTAEKDIPELCILDIDGSRLELPQQDDSERL